MTDTRKLVAEIDAARDAYLNSEGLAAGDALAAYHATLAMAWPTIRSALSQEQGVMVPREPTQAMRDAFIEEIEEVHQFPPTHQHLIAIEGYRAMLKAAPKCQPAKQVKRDNWFRVEVTDRHGQIVAIETEMLAGRDIGDIERGTICRAIRQLRGFVGLPADAAIDAAMDQSDIKSRRRWGDATKDL